jgi:uncharacterized protein YjiS (DUF1127 family)
MSALVRRSVIFTAPRGVFALVAMVASVRRQRKALRTMDDTTLSDIGLSRREAELESLRPLWDIPTGRQY